MSKAFDYSQLLSTNLGDLSNLSISDGNIIVGDGSKFVAESGTTARASLNLTIGTDVQAYNDLLNNISGLTVSEGDMLYVNGSGDITTLNTGTNGQYLSLASGIPAWVTLPDPPTLLDEDNMASNSDTQGATQQSIKAYADTKASLSHTHAASDINSGTFSTVRIPDLDASKITTGTFVDARIPNLAASKITTGTFATARIPSLPASQINSGTFSTARIPGLPASHITSGTFSSARIPNLNASKITAGTLSGHRLPTINNQIGTYVFAEHTVGGDVNLGNTVSGSNLAPQAAQPIGGSNGSVSGTWRCMGAAFATAEGGTTLWVRIS